MATGELHSLYRQTLETAPHRVICLHPEGVETESPSPIWNVHTHRTNSTRTPGIPRFITPSCRGQAVPGHSPKSESPCLCPRLCIYTVTLLCNLEPFSGFANLTVTLGTKIQMQNVAIQVSVFKILAMISTSQGSISVHNLREPQCMAWVVM